MVSCRDIFDAMFPVVTAAGDIIIKQGKWRTSVDRTLFDVAEIGMKLEARFSSQNTFVFTVYPIPLVRCLRTV